MGEEYGERASETLVQGTAEWFTALRVMPLQQDIYDPVRARRALFCAFNLCSHPMNIPVRADAAGAWTLRLAPWSAAVYLRHLSNDESAGGTE